MLGVACAAVVLWLQLGSVRVIVLIVVSMAGTGSVGPESRRVSSMEVLKDNLMVK